MIVDVKEASKIVAVWLTKGEENDPQVQAELKSIYDKYYSKKRTKNSYTVSVYHCGSQDLYQSTLDLLSHNKKCLA